jgi:hypothetical protein
MSNFLMERNFDIDAKDIKGRTVLHHAAMTENVTAIQHLLGLGAEHQLHVRDKNQQTPFELAEEMRAQSVVDYLDPLTAVKSSAASMDLEASLGQSQYDSMSDWEARTTFVGDIVRLAACIILFLLVVYSSYCGFSFFRNRGV